MQVLEGHTDEIFSCAFNYEGDTIITGTVWVYDIGCIMYSCITRLIKILWQLSLN